MAPTNRRTLTYRAQDGTVRQHLTDGPMYSTSATPAITGDVEPDHLLWGQLRSSYQAASPTVWRSTQAPVYAPRTNALVLPSKSCVYGPQRLRRWARFVTRWVLGQYWWTISPEDSIASWVTMARLVDLGLEPRDALAYWTGDIGPVQYSVWPPHLLRRLDRAQADALTNWAVGHLSPDVVGWHAAVDAWLQSPALWDDSERPSFDPADQKKKKTDPPNTPNNPKATPQDQGAALMASYSILNDLDAATKAEADPQADAPESTKPPRWRRTDISSRLRYPHPNIPVWRTFLDQPLQSGSRRRPWTHGDGGPALEGVYLEYPEEWYGSRKVFGDGPSSGGTYLIDGSGSMSWTHEQLVELVERAPGTTIAMYMNDPTIYPKPRPRHSAITILAERGRVVDEHTLAEVQARAGGGNSGSDLPAILWLAQQQAPRVIVTDLEFWCTDYKVPNGHPWAQTPNFDTQYTAYCWHLLQQCNADWLGPRDTEPKPFRKMSHP